MNVLRWTELDPKDALGLIPVCLEKAAAGQDVAYNLSTCLEALENRLGERTHPVLTSSVRDALLPLIVRAEIAAQQYFPAHCANDIHAGMQALAGFVTLWATETSALVERSPHEAVDMRARARILQNHAYSEALREEIEERAYQRRADEIEGLLEPMKGARP